MSRRLLLLMLTPNDDLITSMLSIRDQNKEAAITEKEIVDNVMLIMVAGHDTSSVLITFLIRLLVIDPAVYEVVLAGLFMKLPPCFCFHF